MVLARNQTTICIVESVLSQTLEMRCRDDMSADSNELLDKLVNTYGIVFL